ncbi:MAG: PP2C family protein-serine/threonine phosphatase, partial [Fervidobacterium sp.]
EIRTNSILKGIPIILVIEKKDYNVLFDAYQIGVSDFLELPVVDVEVISKVALHIELKKNREEIENMYTELKNSLEIAKEVQRLMLPSSIDAHNNIWFTSHYQPAQVVGGDIYDYFEIDGKIFGYVADISGHGVQSALLCSSVKSLVRSSAGRNLRLVEVVNELLENMKSALGQNYITGIFFKIESEGLVEYLNCGHPSIITYDGEKFEALDMKHSLPIGLFDYWYTEDDIGYFKLENGITYMFFSDGIYSPFEKKQNYKSSANSYDMLVNYLNKTVSGIVSEALPFYAEQLLRKNFGDLPDDYSVMCIGLTNNYIYKSQNDYRFRCEESGLYSKFSSIVDTLSQYVYADEYIILCNKHKTHSVVITNGVEIGYILRSLPMSISLSFGDYSIIKIFD